MPLLRVMRAPNATRLDISARKLVDRSEQAERARRLQAFRALLAELERDAAEAGRPLSRKQIAEAVQVAPSAVSGWFQGKQIPRAAQLERLAATLAFNDPTRTGQLLERLFGVAGHPLAVNHDPLTLAQTGRAPIVIGIVAFNKYFDDFFEALANAFANFCAFPVQIKPVEFSRLEEDMLGGQLHLAFGFWETPQRLLALRFIGTPITVGMSMLALSMPARAAGHPANPFLSDAIRPILHEGQAAFQIALDVYGIGRHEIVATEYNAGVMARHLVEQQRQAEASEHAKTPVLITDELMALQVCREIINMRHRDNASRHWAPILLRSADKKHWLRSNNIIAAYPRYNISLCVKRSNEDNWYQYVEDAWKIFLRGNIDFVSYQFDLLKKKLEADAEILKDQLASFPVSEGEGGIDPGHIIRNILRCENSLRYHNNDIWNIIMGV